MEMRYNVLSLLLILLIPAGGQELMLFADDHYKVLGGPRIEASPVQAVFQPGENATLQVILANVGRVDGLIPVNPVMGEEAAAARERDEELLSVDAFNLVATLRADGQVFAKSSVGISILPGGSAIPLEIPLRIGPDASGPQALKLDLDYERQVDVSMKGGRATPLYLPANTSLDLVVTVEPLRNPFRAEGVRFDLAGSDGVLLFLVRNTSPKPALNCSASLVEAAPFHPQEETCSLGDIEVGGVSLAQFHVAVDDGSSGRSQLACLISHDGGRSTIAIPLEVGRSSNAYWMILFLPLIALLSLLLARSGMLRRPRRSLRG